MAKIIPAILPISYRDIEIGIEKIEPYFRTVQIDFVDGSFAPNRTWFFNNKDLNKVDQILKEETGLPNWQGIDYEFDLMIKNPLKDIEKLILLGPSKIIFHLESLNTEETIKYFEELPEIIRSSISFGIALNLDSDPEKIKPYLDYIDTIQCMGIAQIGFQGQKFDDRVLTQIKEIKNIFPNKKVSIDGGVKEENIPKLIQAGADNLIIGSLLFQSNDIYATIERVKSLCKKNPTPQENLD